MAETLVGLVSSIVQFIDFSSKIVRQLNEFHSGVSEALKSFRSIKTGLLLLVDTLRRGQRNKLEMAVLAGILKK